MEQNNKKIIMDIVPKPVSRDEKVGIDSDIRKKEDNDFLRKLKETQFPRAEKQEKSGEYKKEIFSAPHFNFRKKIFIIFGILVIFIGGFIFYIFTPASSAIININPISKTESVSAFLKAAENEGDISLSFIKFRQEKEEKIPARGAVNILKKASGKIVIYNVFSASSQTLVKSTRFESSGGKIFMINGAIVVPGTKIVSGKIVPGSVETVIYAMEAGDEYNIDLSDFTIPGFKGTAKYSKFYARSKTSLTGGFKGTAPKINEEDVKKAEKNLKEELEQNIIQKTPSGTDKNLVLLKDGLVTNFSFDTIPYKDDIKFAVVHGVSEISVPVLKKDEIVNYLAKKYLNNSESHYYIIKNFDSLNLKMVKNDSKDAKEITVKIEGNAIFLSHIDKEKLKSELVLRKDAAEVFKTHPEIENAKIILSPFLKRILPKNLSKIKIDIEE